MTATKPRFQIVPQELAPYDEHKGQKRLSALRQQLLRAAVRYVRDGKEMNWHDRLRLASDLSGIPINFIEIEAKK